MTMLLVGLYIGVFLGVVGMCIFSMAKGSAGEEERRLEDEPTFRKENRWRV